MNSPKSTREEARNTPPLFSIITVTYNSADNLVHTLRSVAEQTSPYYEHLIIDGASTDHTRKVIEENPNEHMRFMSAPDKGIYDAMNKGLAEATGEYVIFLNAGDTFHTPRILEQLTEIAFENDFPGVIYGQTDLVDNDRKRVGSRHLIAPDNLTYRSFANGMVVCHQAFAALRRITGEYDMRYRFSADYEWCIRVLQHSRHNVLFPGVMIDYLNEGATTRNRARSLMERFRIMCYFYGTVPTVGRHLGFLLRALRRRFSRRN